MRWQGAEWWFASDDSAARFEVNPHQYRSAYNGFCSNRLSLGEGLIPTNGALWEISDNQLHLFYAERGQKRWLGGDWCRYRQQADAARGLRNHSSVDEEGAKARYRSRGDFWLRKRATWYQT